MPNLVDNIVTLKGENIAEIMEWIKYDERPIGTIDFNKIIPMPGFIKQGDLSGEDYQKFKGHNWYDWRVRHWGTNWAAMYFDEDDFEKAYQYAKSNQLRFVTAWSPPDEVLKELSILFPEIEIVDEYDCAEGMFYGVVVFKNGEEIKCEDRSYEFDEDGNEVEKEKLI